MKNQTLMIGGAVALAAAGGGYLLWKSRPSAPVAVVPAATAPQAYVQQVAVHSPAAAGFDANAAVKTVGEVVNGVSGILKFFQGA